MIIRRVMVAEDLESFLELRQWLVDESGKLVVCALPNALAGKEESRCTIPAILEAGIPESESLEHRQIFGRGQLHRSPRTHLRYSQLQQATSLNRSTEKRQEEHRLWP